jgi:hypothetical protein
MGAALDLLGRQLAEPALHEVEPGARGRGEMELEAGVAEQPAVDGRSLVGGVVIQRGLISTSPKSESTSESRSASRCFTDEKSLSPGSSRSVTITVFMRET